MDLISENDLVFIVKKEDHDEKKLKDLLRKHSEIKFVSLAGIDIFGNVTDEKIPIQVFIEDINVFLKGSIQTDGSSVALPEIAALNNAKVDLVADLDVNWFVNYNFENIDSKTEKPIGTLEIPCFLYHENKPVDSRHILKRAVQHFKTSLFEIFEKKPELLQTYNIIPDDIEDIIFTAGTEIEFWVKTPEHNADIEELSTSQVLQEQYWTRTIGSVRSSLEQALLLMESYGLHPEMGHKEVGGVRAKLDQSGNLTSIMEQLEIDWKYSDALQAADNELLVKTLVKELFRSNGLEVTFLAKPVDGVAGSGAHTHIGISLKLKNGKKWNLFAGPKNHFMSIFGYASLMGILKNYEVINPMVSNTNDSLRRLKPGFEAPVSIVTSLGHNVDMPSRNRTVLIGVVRDAQNPLATRFELRAPNPHTNKFVALAGIYMSMLDAIKYSVNMNKSEDDLLKELSKQYDEDADYLEKNRVYRTEEDIFEDFSEEEREKYFGKCPGTVFENLRALNEYPEKLSILFSGDVFNQQLIKSFKTASISKWITEIERRIIPNYIDEIRSYKMLHSPDKASDLDLSKWMIISNLRESLMKDTYSNISHLTKIKDAIKNKNYDEVSNLQIELDQNMNLLRETYLTYKKNLIDI